MTANDPFSQKSRVNIIRPFPSRSLLENDRDDPRGFRDDPTPLSRNPIFAYAASERAEHN
eukprot:CAMPEP_0172645166 /NCGR_PEP_ID=MMETSP1068-20121228/239586_1 /TAXON_ID=35684 /ORGANISM="Pseudopedinella elastica, Strain CCMP716" /LENGTH=59 /DNA_ID=CAMNT_0013459391 /DNA_START=959 /DNA_END=1138 /DNA_ORIENTATION=-